MSIDVAVDLSLRVASEIKTAMARRGVTGARLAKELGVSAAWVSYRLTGTQEIGINDLQRIAAVLQVKVADLIGHAERGDGAYVSVGSSRPAVTSVPLLPLPRGPLAVSHPGRGWVPPEERRTAPIAPRQRIAV